MNDIVAKYTYDPWGNILSITDSNDNTITDTTHIGYINPFRYRSYYYDTETGLYYLNSRYYNPVWGRFINADGIVGANQDILSYNLYAYCSNNPVNCSDPSGHGSTDLIAQSIANFTREAASNAKLAAKDNVIRATNKPNRTFPMREKTTPNEDLIYKPGKTTPKEIMCPATRPVTNQNGWEYEVGVASSTNIKTPIGKIKVSPQYVERTDSTGTHCYTRIQGSLGTPLIYNISVSYETLVDCATGESIGKGYLTYDESLFFIHLSDGKLSMLFGSSLDKYGITASGGYRMYMLGGY